MSGFVIAYLIVWLGVVGYTVRLGMEQRRLSRAVGALCSQVEDAARSASKAA
jgi:CcmD family protein